MLNKVKVEDKGRLSHIGMGVLNGSKLMKMAGDGNEVLEGGSFEKWSYIPPEPCKVGSDRVGNGETVKDSGAFP